MQTLAAVDIGSNAIRVHIVNLLTSENDYEFKTLEYIRVPLRLGQDVFTIGRLGEEKVDKLTKLAQSLVYFFEIFNVEKYLCCATSAMRDSANSTEVILKIKDQTGFEIQVIDGNKEAEWTDFGLRKYLGEGLWIHVDVGGGSTEINIYSDKKKIETRSFRLGAVRILMKENVDEEWATMIEWIKSVIKPGTKIQAIGTGGNIGKIHQMSNVTSKSAVSLDKIKEITTMIASYSTEERINILKLNPDRADVILPSSKIYMAVMEAAGAKQIYSPKIGLTDGMFEVLKAGL